MRGVLKQTPQMMIVLLFENASLAKLVSGMLGNRLCNQQRGPYKQGYRLPNASLGPLSKLVTGSLGNLR